MTVVTRFAPSPTGYLHIGGARTALFNWLFARHSGGKFLLRIEDTDRARSTEAAVQAIIDGLRWLELDWDGEAVSQFARADRHAAAAHRLLAEGKAYRCYATAEELAEMRERAVREGRSLRYDGRWRDRDPAEAPPDARPVIRLKAPLTGATTIDDMVQGPVTVQNEQLDDMVLLRADGTPVYMLSVVVDDIEMGITHVIRGDDHLTNAFRQQQLYDALGAPAPRFGHVPLIHGPDGAKLSKRHGALAIDAYREMGYLPEALRNYLLRLGWSHGDDEIIDTAQAIAWFNAEAIGRGPSRLDFAKLDHVNAVWLRRADPDRLIGLLERDFAGLIGAPLDEERRARLRRGLDGLRQRIATLKQLAEAARLYVAPRPLTLDGKAAALLAGGGARILPALRAALTGLDDWTEPAIEAALRGVAAAGGLKFGEIAQPLRAALSGSLASPQIFEVAAALGQAETLGRIDDAAGNG